MNFPRAWARLPGPADFLDTILEDLADRTVVLAGLPDGVPGDGLAVEVADLVRQRRLGRWETVRFAEARDRTPSDSLAQRRDGGGAGAPVLWIDATGADAPAAAWAEYVRQHSDSPDMPRLCIAMNAACAEACEEDKRMRRRLWRDFVTPLDARALAERLSRRSGHRPAHIALRSALIAELAGTDLPVAERLSRDPLGRILQSNDHPRECIWAAQVSVLLPLVEREKRRLLNAHRALWRLPHIRKDGTEVRCLNDLEIGDMVRQAQSNGLVQAERQRLYWLRGVRNALAHNEVVPWATLITPVAVRITDFRE